MSASSRESSSGNQPGNLRNTDRAADRGVARHVVAREKCGDFLDRTMIEHRGKPRVDPLTQKVAVGQQDRGGQVDLLADPADPIRLPAGERPAGSGHHLQRADDAAAVVGVKPGRPPQDRVRAAGGSFRSPGGRATSP